jgi:(2Fe-2S) ferredoxin
MSQISNRRRIVVCRGQFYNESRRADQLLRILQPIIDELNGDTYPPTIKLETANCLSMCGGGPNLIIYPEGIICNRVKETDLKSIVKAHLSGE